LAWGQGGGDSVLFMQASADFLVLLAGSPKTMPTPVMVLLRLNKLDDPSSGMQSLIAPPAACPP
jgi:hypothetical protein